MNKSFIFTAILSLLTCFANAQQMPLLQMRLDKNDVENLFAIQRQKSFSNKIVQLSKLYPELEFGRLPEDADEDGRYIRKFDGSGGRPKILIKLSASPQTLPRELLHYFIDLARSRKYPEEMERQRQSYARMLRTESMLYNHKLMSAILHADRSAKMEWQAKLTLNMLEREITYDGENIEALVFLLKHYLELGLEGQDLRPQYKELQRSLENFSQRATILMEGATHGLSSRHARMEEVLNWQPLADRLLGVFERLEAIESFLQRMSAMSIAGCEVLVFPNSKSQAEGDRPFSLK